MGDAVLLPIVLDASVPSGLIAWGVGLGYWSWPASAWSRAFGASCVLALGAHPMCPAGDVALVELPGPVATTPGVVLQLVATAGGRLETLRADAA